MSSLSKARENSYEFSGPRKSEGFSLVKEFEEIIDSTFKNSTFIIKKKIKTKQPFYDIRQKIFWKFSRRIAKIEYPYMIENMYSNVPVYNFNKNIKIHVRDQIVHKSAEFLQNKLENYKLGKIDIVKKY